MIEPIDMAAFMDAYQTPGRGGRGCPKVFTSFYHNDICFTRVFVVKAADTLLQSD